LTKTRLKICFILKILNVPDGKDKHLKSEIDIVEWNLVLAHIGGHKDIEELCGIVNRFKKSGI
jgi:hypothetical protein